MPNDYQLLPKEANALRVLSSEVTLAKIAVYNLEEQLETARAAVSAAEGRFSGALQMVASVNDMEGARLSDDFAKLTMRSNNA